MVMKIENNSNMDHLHSAAYTSKGVTEYLGRDALEAVVQPNGWVFAIGPGGWEGGLQAAQTSQRGGFGIIDGNRTA